MLDHATARELGRPIRSADEPNVARLPDGFDTVSATFVLLCLPDELQERLRSCAG